MQDLSTHEESSSFYLVQSCPQQSTEQQLELELELVLEVELVELELTAVEVAQSHGLQVV